jgi:hypothetical protein
MSRARSFTFNLGEMLLKLVLLKLVDKFNRKKYTTYLEHETTMGIILSFAKNEV